MLKATCRRRGALQAFGGDGRGEARLATASLQCTRQGSLEGLCPLRRLRKERGCLPNSKGGAIGSLAALTWIRPIQVGAGHLARPGVSQNTHSWPSPVDCRNCNASKGASTSRDRLIGLPVELRAPLPYQPGSW